MLESSLEKLAKEFETFKNEKTSKHYPKHLKDQAVQLFKDGVPAKRLCEKLGIHATTFGYWRRATKKTTPFSKASIVHSGSSSTLTVVTGVPIDQLGAVIKQLT